MEERRRGQVAERDEKQGRDAYKDHRQEERRSRKEVVWRDKDRTAVRDKVLV